MIDQRLQQSWQVEARTKAVAALDKHPRLADIDGWLAGWWTRWETACPATYDAQWPEEAIADLRARRPIDDEVTREVETRIVHRRRDSSRESVGGLLIARVLGRLTGSGPISCERFLRSAGLPHYSWGQEFFSAFAGVIPAGSAERWISELSAIPGTLEACCGTWLAARPSIEMPALQAHEARGIAEGERRDLWNQREPRELTPATSVVIRLRALFAIAPAAATSAFARIPTMSLRQLYMYFLGLNDDPDALLRAVENAPLLWDGDQQWTGNTSAVPFIEAVTKYAAQLASAVEQPAHPQQADPSVVDRLYRNELPEFFRRVARTLLARGDGHWLAIDYAAALLRRTSWPRNQDAVRVERLAVDALLDALRATGFRPADVRRIERRRLGADASWDDRAEFLSVAGFMVDSPTAARDTWARFEALLLDAGEQDITATMESYVIDTPLVLGFGHALAETASPSESWLATWQALFVRRERSRFSVLNVKGLLSSAYLAVVGLSALRFLLPTRDEAAKALWQEVARSLRCLASAPQERAVSLDMHQLVAVPWAFAPRLYGDAWSVHLDEQWRDVFLVDPNACLLAADFLIRNGLARPHVLATMKDAGCDPLALGDKLCRWMDAKGFGTSVGNIDVAALLVEVRGA